MLDALRARARTRRPTSASCSSRRAPVNASLRSRPLPTAPRPMAKNTRGSWNPAARLLDLIERQRAAGDAMRAAARTRPESAGCSSAGYSRRAPLDRIVIDRPCAARARRRRSARTRSVRRATRVRPAPSRAGDVAVELAALRFDRAVVDVAVADVEVEQLIEASGARGLAAPPERSGTANANASSTATPVTTARNDRMSSTIPDG